MIILLDAMGGDNAPDANIKGAIKAINQIKAEVVLIGKEEYNSNKVSVIRYDKKDIKHYTIEEVMQRFERRR